MRHRRLIGAAIVVTAGWVAGRGLDAQSGTTGQWRSVGGDSAYTRYSPLDQINKTNVRTLKIAWRKPGVDPALKEA